MQGTGRKPTTTCVRKHTKIPKRVCQSGISIGYGRHDLYGKHPVPPREEVELLVAQGVQLKDIAILVRKNRSIPLIADYFDKNTSYKIVSDEAFRLDASLAVCMIMDSLRYLSQPGNRIAKAQLAAAYQNEVLHKGIDLNTLLLNEIDDYLPFDFIKEAEQLRLMPLYELMEKLFNLFQMSCIKQQDAYLCASLMP